MLSKNNRNELINKQTPKRQRFTLKKLTIGVASVLIGFTFMGIGASADTTNANTQPTDNGHATKNGSDSQLNGQKVVLGQSFDQTAQQQGQQSSAANSGASNASNSGAATNGNNESSSESTQTVNLSDLGQGSTVGLNEMKPAVRGVDTQDVATWQQFVTQLSDKNVTTINLTGDIDVNGPVSGMTGGNGYGWRGALTLTRENIARQVTINGNGHTLNFGRYSLMFENANQNDGSAWDITFEDLKIKAGQTDTSGLINYMNGVLSPISFKDVNKDNQSKDVVTFDGVTADVSTRPVISGADYQKKALLNAKLDETYTLNFKGNNVITNTGYQGSSTSPDDGNAVEAGYINFLDGTTTTINMTQTGESGDNYGGNAVRAVQDGTSVNIADGANVTITGGKDVRGIYAGADKLTGALDGLVNVDGNLTEIMGTGHSTAINAGNLTVGQTGKIDITTAQDNNQGLVGNLTFNGNHYGVIALGVGHLQGTYSSTKNTLTDNGSIKINRTATGKLSAPLIAFGGGGVTGNYELTVNNGATLDLQDAADQESSDHAGMIVMFGTSSTDKINFNNPAYVNLQRTAGKGSSLDNVTGNFITTQGKVNNAVNITGTTPVAQWDEGNMSDTPSFVWSINDQKTMSNWGTNAYTFTPSGKNSPQDGKGQTKLMHSNGTVIMGANQAGKDSFKFDNGTTVPGTPNYTNKGQYYAPYLNSYLNNFSWWTPQRLTIGSASYINQADEYQPEAQTINGNTSQTLSDLQAKDGIKDLITQDDSTIPLPSDATVTWYNPATDSGTWTTVMGNQPVPTNPTGNLKTTDTSAWAKVTYGDGSVDFVNIPLNITDENIPAIPSTKTDADQNDPKGKNVTTTVGTVPSAKDGVQWPTGQPQDVQGNSISLPDSAYTWVGGNPDVSKAGTVPAVVNITYPDGSQDQVAVNVIVKDAAGNVPSIDPTKDNGKYDPEGKTVTTTIGTPVDPSATIDWPNGAPTDGTPTYTWSTEPDIWSQGQHPGVVKVTYHDGTSELVPVKVDVTNAPSGKETTVPQGQPLPDPSTVINWTNPDGTSTPAPSGATYEWTTSPDTNTPGTKNGVVTITYPNGEKTPVVVPITVTPTSTTGAYNPYVQPQNYPYDPNGNTPTVPTVNLPSGETAPTGVHYTWGIKPDTTKANTTQSATVIATYPDPNDSSRTITKTIPVIAHIGSMADYYDPKATDLPVPFNADMNNYPAANQISNVPANVVSYDAWAPTPVTIVSGTQPTMIKVTYTDGSWDYVPLNVTVGPAVHTQDADKYQPEYGEKTATQGQTLTDPVAWSTTDGNQGNPADHSSSATFAKVTATDTQPGTPSWVTVAPDGTLTLTNVPAGTYSIPVKVTYGDNSSEIVYAPVTVTGTSHDDNTVWVYGQNTQSSFRIATFDTHKTNDGSANAMADVNAPKLDKLVFTNQAYNKNTHQYKNVSSVTYMLNADGTKYVATSVFLNGQTINNPTLAQIQQVKSNAVLEFNVSEVQTSWMTESDPWSQGKDRRADTDTSNFTPGSGTGTSLANSQYGDPNGDQRSKSGEELAGNSRARANINLTGDAANIFGNNIGWINVFGNFYGATTGTAQTYKQNSDISNLSQDEFRKLINVSDLGANGWNGTNINPNAPQVLAYEPGTDASKTFTMTWAPNGMPSTATVANGVGGTVRILFNDGTYLDVPATINVVKDNDAGKPDTDKAEFSQKIIYIYNGQEVAYTSIDKIAKGDSLTATQLRDKINANVPSNYQIASDYIYPDAVNNITATPKPIKVKLSLKDHATFAAEGHIVYRTADGTQVGTGSDIKTNKGDTLTAGLLHDLADQHVPSGYKIVTYPGTITVSEDNFTIPVIVEKNSETPVEDTKVTYQFHDDTDNVNVGSPIVVTGKPGTSQNTGLTIPSGGYKLAAGQTLPSTVTMPNETGETIIIHLVHDTKDVNPTDPGVNPDDTKYQDLFKTATRKIYQTQPGQTSAQLIETQTVQFGRSGVEDLVTGVVTGTGTWEAGTIQNHKFVPGGSSDFAEFTAPQISGYDSYVDGVKATSVSSTSALVGGQPTDAADVHITYLPSGDHTTPVPFVPSDKNDDMNHYVIRTINIYNPGSTTPIVITQVVHFGRDGIKDEHGDITWNAWKVVENNTLSNSTTGTWDEYDVEHKDHYTSTVDGIPANKVNAQTVNADTPDAKVTVAYTQTIQPDNPSINPNNPGQNSDMYAHPTRTIHVVYPDGTTHDTVQTVWFGRTKTVSTDPNVATTYGDWQLGKVENNRFTIDPSATSQWGEFTAPTFSGYTPSQARVAAETVSATTPDATVTITYHGNGSVTPPTPTEDQVTITYVEKDNPSHILGTASVTGNNGSSVAVKSTIEGNVPAHWKIDPSYTVPESETVPGSVTVPLVHATKTVKPGDPGVDPNDPLYQGMFKTVTRTINVNNPDGTVDPTLQQVHFNRSETIDEVTGKVLSYGPWSLADGSARDWGEFDVPQLSGYTSYVDGNAAKQVNEEAVTPETADVTVEVTYKTAGDHGDGDHGQTPSNPGDHNKPSNPGDHNTPTTPGQNGNGQGNQTATNTGKPGAANSKNNKKGQANAKKTLPQTGNTKDTAALAGLGLLGLTSLLGFGKRKQD